MGYEGFGLGYEGFGVGCEGFGVGYEGFGWDVRGLGWGMRGFEQISRTRWREQRRWVRQGFQGGPLLSRLVSRDTRVPSMLLRCTCCDPVPAHPCHTTTPRITACILNICVWFACRSRGQP